MIIKLDSIIDGKLGKSAAKFIKGKKVGSNEEWSKGFFANNKELRDKLSDFEPGEFINVVLEKKGDFYNIVDFKEVSDDEIETAVENAKKWSKKSDGNSGQSTGVRRADGGSRGDDTNRSAAIYLAKEFVIGISDSPEDLAIRAAQIADAIIYPYIKDGIIPVEDKPKRTRKAEKAGDPLAPPSID